MIFLYLRFLMYKRLPVTRQQSWIMLISLLLMSFPWHERLNAVFVVLIMLHWLADPMLAQKIRSLRDRLKLIFPFWLIFLLLLIWLPATDNPTDAWHTLEVKLTLLIMPLMFGSENYFTAETQKKTMLAFCLSCVGVSLYCLAYYFIYEYPKSGTGLLFNRMVFSAPVMHAGYLSNFFVIAIIYLSSRFFTSPPPVMRQRMLYGFLILFFLAVTLILVSQTAMIILLLYAIATCWKLLNRFNHRWLRLTLFGVGILGMLAFLTLVPNTRHRLTDTLQNLRQTDSSVKFGNSTGSRVAAWGLEWALIKANPIIGYGTGDANALLLQKFREGHYTDLFAYQMHTHNQFLHSWIELGIAGPVGLLVFFGFGFIKFYQRKNETGCWTVLLFLLYCATDDAFEIQAVTVFFVTMISLLLFEECRLVVKSRTYTPHP